MNAQLKLKTCKVCKRKFQPYSTIQNTCSGKCFWVLDAKQKKQKARKAKREFRERTKTLATLCKETQRLVNAYVRCRDFSQKCISCDGARIDDAGHFFPIGSKYRCNRLRFDLSAIHGQCRQCNSYKGGGNVHGYIEGLTKRYGRSYVDDLYALKARADQGLLAPLTKDEVRAIASEYRRMARELSR